MNKRKIYEKLLLDLVLLVLLALMYRKQAIGMCFHEWGGLALCGLFLIHKALNWKWIRAVTSGIFQGKVKLNARWIVDALLLVSMTAVLLTGLLISKTLPTAIANGHGLQMWHYFFAAAALVLSGIHLGLHGAHLKNHLWNRLPLPQKAGKMSGTILLCILFCFGSYHLLTSGFPSHFLRPFSIISLSQREGPPEFSEMEHPQGFGKGMGEGAGRGMGNGMGRGKDGQGHGMNHSISPASAISTFLTYASILCWFAIATAALSRCFQKRFQTNKSISDT